ncbi:MAG: hypothetical protein OHK0037_32820 [Elainellaceae cyanobacterium]
MLGIEKAWVDPLYLSWYRRCGGSRMEVQSLVEGVVLSKERDRTPGWIRMTKVAPSSDFCCNTRCYRGGYFGKSYAIFLV